MSHDQETLFLRVWKGMTVSDLAVHFRTDEAAVRLACGLRDDRLRAGQTCGFPLGGFVPVLHDVQPGETMGELSRRYGLPSHYTVRTLNCIPTNRIVAGQRLLILVPADHDSEGTDRGWTC